MTHEVQKNITLIMTDGYMISTAEEIAVKIDEGAR
jgi:hypothetical protein